MILLSPEAVDDVERLRSFLDQKNPNAAQRALLSIWAAVDQLVEFPELGAPTANAAVRQLVVSFGASGYIVRYAVLGDDILIYANLARQRGSTLNAGPALQNPLTIATMSASLHITDSNQTSRHL